MAEISEREVEEIARQQFWGAKTVHAYFTLQPVRNAVESRAKGYPVYDERPYVMVLKDDEQDHISVLATQDHVRQFPQEWAAFREHLKRPRMPLLALPGIKPGAIAAFAELGIRTIDDLVDASITTDAVLTEGIQITDDMIDQDVDYLADMKPRRAVPEALARWRDVAMHYIVFRAKAEGKEPPALRLVSGHFEIAPAASDLPAPPKLAPSLTDLEFAA